MKLTTVASLCILIALTSCSKKNTPAEGTEEYKIYKAGFTSCKIYSADFLINSTDNPGRLMQEYFYSPNGQISEIIRYNIDGTINHRIRPEVKQNDSINIAKPIRHVSQSVEVLQMDENNQVIRKEIQIFDKNGYMIEKLVLNANNDTLRMNKYKYNEWGLITEDIYYENNLSIPFQIIRYQYSK